MDLVCNMLVDIGYPCHLYLVLHEIKEDLHKVLFFNQKSTDNTDDPLYNNTRYNDKIPYNENLTVMKPLLKR